tara:strand:+ start:78 stop:869 length:792 start_codon:yes stop_codon:yes gene_type:complete
MKIIETEGIVLKKMDFKDNDCILTFLTRDEGKKAGVFRGVKSFKSGNSAKAELFVENYFVYSEKVSSDLVSIRKCELIDSFHTLRKNYSKILHANYFSELLLKCEIPANESKDYFHLLKQTFYLLSNSERGIEIKLNFELQLLNLLGIRPHLEDCANCGAELWNKKSRLNAIPKFTIPYQLDAGLGGVRCPNCSTSNSAAVNLHPGSLAFFRERYINLNDNSLIRPTQNNLKELDKAILVYFSHFFGDYVKSHALLKENLWKI